MTVRMRVQFVRIDFRFIVSAVATIGFEQTLYSASEADGVVQVAVAVLNGTLGRDVQVRITSTDGTPISRFEFIIASI